MSGESNEKIQCEQNNIVAPSTQNVTATVMSEKPTSELVPQQHSNDNLLKMDTHDKYSTVNALKKLILKSLSAHYNSGEISHHNTDSNSNSSDNNKIATSQWQSSSSSVSSAIQTLLPGLLRMNKNPHSPFLFMAFATPQDRSNALNLLSTMQHRKKMKWNEVKVSAHDLALTHKGGQQHKRIREQHPMHTEMCVDGDYTEKTKDDYEKERHVKSSSNSEEKSNISKLADYAHLTLEQQHKLKYKHCWDILRSLLSYSQWQQDQQLQPQLLGTEKQQESNSGKKATSIRSILAHRVNELFYDGVLSSPVCAGYRNHVNLSFGYDEVGKPALGFNKGAVLDGTAAIESVTWDMPSLLTEDNNIWNEQKQHCMKDALRTRCQEKDITSLTTHNMARLIATAIMQICNKLIQQTQQPEPHNSTDSCYCCNLESCRINNHCLSLSGSDVQSAQEENKVPSLSLPVYDKVRDFGFWRKVQIRHSVKYEAMVTITVNEGEYVWMDKVQNNNSNKRNDSDEQIQCKQTDIHLHKGKIEQALQKVKALIVQSLTSESFTRLLQEVCQCTSAKVVSIHYCTLSPLCQQKLSSSIKQTSQQHNENQTNNEVQVSKNTQSTQIHENGKNYELRDIILFGSATLTQHLCNYRFELSPASFFQVNTPGMERLLNTLIHRANLRVAQSTLLDLCCGTGTIGLVLSQYVKRVVGIELVPEAVSNARVNCALNHITNATFHVGRVEHVLPIVIQSLLRQSSNVNAICTEKKEVDEDQAKVAHTKQNNAGITNTISNAIDSTQKDEFIAILDPPRAGVNSTVLKWIRGTMAITKVIYISCDQNALLRDCPLLTKLPSKAYRGKPFHYTATFAVDLFPHTRHVEMIVVLSR